MRLSKKKPHSQSGMTLVEIMVAMLLGTAIIATATSFLVEVTRATVKTTNRSSGDLMTWDIYAQISIDSKVANGMCIYKDFTKASFDPDVNFSNVRKPSGARGDLLVLTRSEPTGNLTNPTRITNVVGFYYDRAASTFKRFTFPLNSTDSVERILTDNYGAMIAASVTLATDVTATVVNPDLTSPSNPDPSDPNPRAFLCRDQKGQSGVLNIQLLTQTGNLKNYKIVEAAFVVRP